MGACRSAVGSVEFPLISCYWNGSIRLGPVWRHNIQFTPYVIMCNVMQENFFCNASLPSLTAGVGSMHVYRNSRKRAHECPIGWSALPWLLCWTQRFLCGYQALFHHVPNLIGAEFQRHIISGLNNTGAHSKSLPGSVSVIGGFVPIELSVRK